MPNAPITQALWLRADLKNSLVEMARDHYPLETGGILLGYRSSGDVVITDVIGPGPNAIHSRAAFLPDHDFHVQEAVRVFKLSEGKNSYLGDWHTHPDGAALMSDLDKRTLRSIASDDTAHCPSPVMLILSGGRVTWSSNAFCLAPGVFLRSVKRLLVRNWSQ